MTFAFELDDDLSAVQDLVTSLALDVVDPTAREAESARSVPTAVRKVLHESGLVVPVPEDHGGQGVPDGSVRLLVTEGLAFGDPAIAVSMLWQGAVPAIIGACGTHEQCEDLLPRFANDPGHSGGFAFYEGFGRAPSEFATTLSVDGGRHFLSGRKLLVQAPSAEGPLLVVARDEQRRLLSVVLDPADPAVTLHPSGPYLGLDAIATVTVVIEGEIDERSILGGPEPDTLALARELAVARLSVAAASVGGARRAVHYAASYAKDRVAFGRPISTFQGVAFLAADAHMRVEAAWLQLRQTLDLVENAADQTFEREVSHAVGYALSAASEAARDCIQILGGHGFLTDHPVERWYRATAGLSTIDLDPTTHAFTPPL